MNAARPFSPILLALTVVVGAGCSAQSPTDPSWSTSSESSEASRAAVAGWQCTTNGGGTQKSPDGSYYATSFGCWLDSKGNHRGDANDNCIPWCIDHDPSICNGKDGKTCEETIQWFAAGERRHGCGTRLRVTNPQNQKSVVVMVIDRGPNCSIEKQVSHWAVDLSYPTTNYLFGEPKGVTEEAEVTVEEVASSTALGPVAAPDPNQAGASDPNQAGTADACGGLSFEGACEQDTVQWCEAGAVKSIDCAAAGASCGWNDQTGYYDCLGSGAGTSGGSGGSGGSSAEQNPPPADDCGGITWEGECQGDSLVYCDGGQVVTVDCGAQGASCSYDPSGGVYACWQSSQGSGDDGTCGGVTSVGQCDGEVLSYCDNGSLTVADCAAYGLQCSWDSGNGYYDCL